MTGVNDYNDYLLIGTAKPDWLQYPAELLEMVRAGRVRVVPWHLSKAAAAAGHAAELKARVKRDLVPFAFRQDQEDLACFEKGKGQQVMLVHDNCDSPYEHVGSYPSFADWLRAAEEESEEWGETA
ncbi:MAG TPA: hypothetical protein VK324_13720 [Tepidisphaeraceae bacterium]|nr:hypothetical protein [Tepidisphaeraceae bacterium]